MKTATTIPINELILGCKLGDRQMQQALYHQTSAKMFAICLRYAKDRMEAEDEDCLYWWRRRWTLFLYFDEEAGSIT